MDTRCGIFRNGNLWPVCDTKYLDRVIFRLSKLFELYVAHYNTDLLFSQLTTLIFAKLSYSIMLF